jgi:NADH dehydrogenase
MILVVGSTGFLGTEICRRLAADDQPVRALVRRTSDPAAVSRLKELGVETVEGDLRDRTSLEAACRSATAVVSTATTTRSRQPGDSIEATDQQGQLNLVEAARAAGVSRFSYVSYSGGITGADPLTTAKRSVERRLRDSGMTYTILRPTFFMEFWLSPTLGFDFANARATIYGTGRDAISWISLGDVAEFAVRTLNDPAGADATLELGGPEALSPMDVVRIFEEVGGKQFELQHVPEDALQAQQQSATDSLSRAFAALMLAYARGDSIAMDAMLQRYPVRLKSVREYANSSLVPT